jgi:hypothetical protein
VLIGAVPRLMLKTEANPGELGLEAFDHIRASVLAEMFRVSSWIVFSA